MTGDISVARTMAIQALVMARVVYLLSISQLGTSILQYLRSQVKTIEKAPILLLGIIVAIILQVLFSQWSVMNTLFGTKALNLNQWLIVLIPIFPMIPTAILANRVDSQSLRN
jgi:magnesium-transporting ATPase (P-type)